jgi:hypothetical protein
MKGKLELRQLEFGHLNFGNVEFMVEFRNFSNFQRSFDNIAEFHYCRFSLGTEGEGVRVMVMIAKYGARIIIIVIPKENRQ